jgi:hypothetical protein
MARGAGIGVRAVSRQCSRNGISGHTVKVPIQSLQIPLKRPHRNEPNNMGAAVMAASILEEKVVVE